MNRFPKTADLYYRVTIMHDLEERSFNEWLVIESQRGEKDAFNTLIRHWEQRYFLYAMNRRKNRKAAKDVTQENLISISRSLRKLSEVKLSHSGEALRGLATQDDIRTRIYSSQGRTARGSSS